jgi:hypothetical protein
MMPGAETKTTAEQRIKRTCFQMRQITRAPTSPPDGAAAAFAEVAIGQRHLSTSKPGGMSGGSSGPPDGLQNSQGIPGAPHLHPSSQPHWSIGMGLADPASIATDRTTRVTLPSTLQAAAASRSL